MQKWIGLDDFDQMSIKKDGLEGGGRKAEKSGEGGQRHIFQIKIICVNLKTNKSSRKKYFRGLFFLPTYPSSPFHLSAAQPPPQKQACTVSALKQVFLS